MKIFLLILIIFFSFLNLHVFAQGERLKTINFSLSGTEADSLNSLLEKGSAYDVYKYMFSNEGIDLERLNNELSGKDALLFF